MSIQDKLEQAIDLYGIGDIRTLLLSKARDKEIVEEQKKLYEAYKGWCNEFFRSYRNLYFIFTKDKLWNVNRSYMCNAYYDSNKIYYKR